MAAQWHACQTLGRCGVIHGARAVPLHEAERMSPPAIGWHVCVRCGVVVVIEVERCVDGSALALRMGGATVPFARNVERYARMPDRRCAFLKMLHDDVVSISRARSPPGNTI